MVSVVESLEVSSVDLHHVVHLITYTQSEAGGVGSKSEIIHVGISIGIEGTLYTCADFPLLRQIILSTEEIFNSTTFEQIVAVCAFQARLSLFVKVVVVAQVETKAFYWTNLCTNGEQCWDVAAHLSIILVGCKGS